MSGFTFPKWVNTLRPVVAAGVLAAPVYIAVLAVYGANPVLYDQGYAPRQPVDYSHALHAGQLGLDCRYCHTNVDKAAHANIPATQTCMNCHTNVKPKSPKLAAVRESWAEDKPIQWNKVHRLADYVYFNHSAHVNRGVGCASCHGRIDTMEVVAQAKPLSMGWCLECHRAPEKHLRPLDKITDMAYGEKLSADEQLAKGLELKKQYNIQTRQECSTCHH
jgi:hypothetical protein